MLVYSYLNPSIKRKVSHFFRSSHSNFLEANAILNSLKKTGLKISSFDHDSTINIECKKITHVFGYGNPVFQVISKSLNREIKFIHYLTGSEKNFQNNAEIKRVNYFNNKYSAKYIPRRIVNEPHSLEEFYIKKVILIGNKKTQSTYQERINSGDIIKTINATSPIKLNDETKNFIYERFFNSETKKILFISGSGLVHKGLDLVLEAIKDLNTSKIELHIMSPYEKDFFKPLKNLVSKPNIIYHGFKNLKSISTRKIIESCHFIISPSCSEGQSTSVLAGMTCGLVPIITEECGIDINEDIYLLKSLSSKDIAQALDNALSLNFKNYKNKSERSMELIKKNHQIKNFQYNIEKFLFHFGFHDFQ